VCVCRILEEGSGATYCAGPGKLLASAVIAKAPAETNAVATPRATVRRDLPVRAKSRIRGATAPATMSVAGQEDGPAQGSRTLAETNA
jgi:hypothetical protein